MGKRQSFDLPICSERRTASLCNRDCEAGNLLETCECLYDADVTDSTPPDGMLGEMPCPDGQICCFNMPCSRITTGSAGDCQAAGGADANGEGGNCELAIVGNQLECTCRAPLETVENPDLFAPYDCTCPFISDAEWLAQGGTGECIDDGTGNNEPTEGLSKAAIRRASLRLASLLQDLNVDEFKERCPTDTLRVTGKAAERICKRLEKLFNKFKVPTVKVDSEGGRKDWLRLCAARLVRPRRQPVGRVGAHARRIGVGRTVHRHRSHPGVGLVDCVGLRVVARGDDRSVLI